jgi:hypothetical protein
LIDIYSDKGSFLKGMLVVTNFLFSCLKFFTTLFSSLKKHNSGKIGEMERVVKISS